MLSNELSRQSQPRRNGNATVCRNCGAEIRPRRGSRRQAYCNDRCRQAVRREQNFAWAGNTRPNGKSAAGALKNGARYPYQGSTGSVQNTPTKSVTCKGDFGGRAFADKPSRALLRHINEIERFAPHAWTPAVSSDGVPVLIARLGKRPFVNNGK